MNPVDLCGVKYLPREMQAIERRVIYKGSMHLDESRCVVLYVPRDAPKPWLHPTMPIRDRIF